MRAILTSRYTRRAAILIAVVSLLLTDGIHVDTRGESEGLNAAQRSTNSSLLHWSGGQAFAEKRRRGRGKRKRYERAQKEVKRLLEAGHPPVTITIKTSPRVRAGVYHGKEKLGTTPLQLTWTKDTGPIDLTLRAGGYLTVNSRFYTHRNDRVTIQMFKTTEAHRLFGYKKKVKSKEEEAGAEEAKQE